MATMRVDNITDAAGTGAPSFTNGYTVTNAVIFSVKKNTNQLVTSGAATTLSWETEEFDVGNNFAANTFTVPAAGYYEFHLGVKFEPSSGAETMTTFACSIAKNGTVVYTIERFPRDAATGQLHTIAGSAILLLAASDLVTVTVTATTLGAGSIAVEGGTATDTSLFQGKRLYGY